VVLLSSPSHVSCGSATRQARRAIFFLTGTVPVVQSGHLRNYKYMSLVTFKYEPRLMSEGEARSPYPTDDGLTRRDQEGGCSRLFLLYLF
jgi:hypothetical protein